MYFVHTQQAINLLNKLITNYLNRFFNRKILDIRFGAEQPNTLISRQLVPNRPSAKWHYSQVSRCFEVCLRKSKNNFLFLLLTIIAYQLSAQKIDLPKEPIREALIGMPGREWINALAVNWQGQVAAAGIAANGNHGGDDIYILTFDNLLNLRHENHIGRSGDDGANYIGTSAEGHYLVAGYSTAPKNYKKLKIKYFGGKDAWLLWVNESGRMEREIMLGTPADDEFVYAAPMPNGNIALVGNTDKSAWMLYIDPAGKVIREKKLRYHGLETRAKSALLTTNNELFIVGEAKEEGGGRLWLTGYDANGKMMCETIFPASKAKDGAAIVEIDSETLAIAGNVDDPHERENGFYCLIGKNGEVKKYRAFGGRETDVVTGLSTTWQGLLVTTGSSRSFERGSRRDRAWVRALDLDGDKKSERYYGSKFDDEARSILQHPDGRLFTAGYSGKNILRSRQAWIMQLGEPEKKIKARRLEVSIGAKVSTAKDQDFLMPGARSFLNIDLKNQDTAGVCGLRAVIEPIGSTPTTILSAGKDVMLPALAPGSTTHAYLPFRISSNAPAGRWRFKAQVYQGETAVGAPQVIECQIGTLDMANLVLNIRDTLVFDPAKPEPVVVTISNKGSAPARNAVLSCANLSGFEPLAPINLGDLQPGASVKIPVVLKAHGAFTGGNVYFRVADAELVNTAAKSLYIQPNVSPVVASKTESGTEKDYVVAIWVSPNPDNFDHKEMVWNDREITVQIKIVSNQPVERTNFCLEINGRPCDVGQKFDEVQIKGDRLSKTFRQTVTLTEGKNELRATIQNKAGQTQSEKMTVLYAPSKPNLHVIAIGVTGNDLKYTGRDAAEFARALATDNTAFQNVFIDTLVTEAQTTKTEILKAFRRLQYRHADLQIRPQDLLVVFLSSHGFGAAEGGFRIAAADYDGPFMSETSLDFEKELLAYLQPVQCRKLLFVDACNSGAATAQQNNGTLVNIAAGQKDLNLVLSCRADEYSYEDESWKHGAFTQSLLSAFGDFRQKRDDTTPYLDVSSLFSRIEKDIPQLVARKKPKTKTEQHPLAVLTNGGGNIVLMRR
jgi:Caspase domain